MKKAHGPKKKAGKKVKSVVKVPAVHEGAGEEPFVWTYYALTFLVPLLVLPLIIDNAFNQPKNLLLILGVVLLLAVYSARFFLGKEVSVLLSPTPKVLIFLVAINLFSFLYTENPYYTAHAAAMNITCLLLFYFLSLHVDGQKAFRLLLFAGLSGLLVAMETWLEFFDVFILFPWAHKGIMVMGTIGNSNYLGAYLVFPLFALVGLIFLLKGMLRLLPAAALLFMLAAFLFSRARAGWMGFFLALPVFLLLVKRIHGFSLLSYLKSHLKPVITYSLVTLALVLSIWAVSPQKFRDMMSFEQVTKSKTLRLRMEKYFRGSWWLFKQNPLFGTGLWSFRNAVYTAQAEINKTDPSFFKDYPEPKPRRVHNEYLEILNDGGLLAAGALTLFFLMVMAHGWRTIRDDQVPGLEKTIVATAFSSLIAIMLTGFFFFPFRINSTMFMTVLMMGIVEGIYSRRYGLIGKPAAWKFSSGPVLMVIVVLALMGFAWYTAVKPFLGEVEHFKYKQALARGQIKEAEQHLLKAIDYDPHNTAYCIWAGQLYFNNLKDFGKADDFITRTIIDFNGDVVPWAAQFYRGLIRFQMGNPIGARQSFEKALYYNPTFVEAAQKLAEADKVIKEHDRILIKFR